MKKLVAIGNTPASSSGGEKKPSIDYKKLVSANPSDILEIPNEVLYNGESLTPEGEEICLIAFERDGTLLRVLPVEVLLDEAWQARDYSWKLCKAAIKQNPSSIQYCPQEILFTERGFKLCERAIRQKESNIWCMPKKLLVHRNETALTYYGEKFFKILVERNPNFSSFTLPKEFFPGYNTTPDQQTIFNRVARHSMSCLDKLFEEGELVEGGALTPLGNMFWRNIDLNGPCHIAGLPTDFLLTEEGQEICKKAVLNDVNNLNIVPKQLLVKDGQPTKMALDILKILLDGDETLSDIPNPLSCDLGPLPEEKSKQIQESCKRVVSQFETLPEWMMISEDTLTIFGKEYLKIIQDFDQLSTAVKQALISDNGDLTEDGIEICLARKTELVPTFRHSFIQCNNLEIYLQNVDAINQKDLTCAALTVGDFLTSEGRFIMEKGHKTAADTVLHLPSDSKYNGALDPGARFELALGDEVTIHETTKIVMVTKRDTALSPDVFSRCHAKHNSLLLTLVNSLPEVEVPTAAPSVDLEGDHIQRKRFDSLDQIIDPLQLARMKFKASVINIVGDSEDLGPLIVSTPLALHGWTGDLSNTLKVSSIDYSPEPSKCINFDTVPHQDLLPLLPDHCSVGHYCRLFLNKDARLEKETVADYFKRKIICLPIQKNPELYQTVFQDEISKKWHIRFEGNNYEIKDVKFYDLTQASIQHFSTQTYPISAPLESHLSQLYYNSTEVCTTTTTGKHIFKSFVEFMDSDSPLTIFEGSPATGKDCQLEQILKILKQTDPEVDFRSITAGSDFPLLQQVQEAVDKMLVKDQKKTLVIKISEINLCSSKAIEQVSVWAKAMGLSLKIIGTQNDTQTSETRFSTDTKLKPFMTTVPDYTTEDLRSIVDKMWAPHLEKGALDVDHLIAIHTKATATHKGPYPPRVRVLQQCVEFIGTNPDPQARIPFYDKFSFSEKITVANFLEPKRALPDHEEGADGLKAQNFRLIPGKNSLPGMWRSSNGKTPSNTSLRVPLIAHEVQHPEVAGCLTTSPEPSSQIISATVKGQSSIPICYMPNKKGLQFFVDDTKGFPLKSTDYKIENGEFFNLRLHSAKIYIISDTPPPNFSTVYDSLDPHIKIDTIDPGSALSDQEKQLITNFISHKRCDTLLQALGIDNDASPLIILKGLFKFFNGFHEAHYTNTPITEDLDTHHKELFYYLINRNGVCRHQAQLMKILCAAFGFDIDSIDNGTHAFNIVKKDGAPYFIMDFQYFRHNDLGVTDYKEINAFNDEFYKDYLSNNPRLFFDIERYLLNPHDYDASEALLVKIRDFKAQETIKIQGATPQTTGDEEVDVSAGGGAAAGASTTPKTATETIKSMPPCTFESILKLSATQETCPWPIETLLSAIQQDHQHTLNDWVEIQGGHPSVLIQDALGHAIAYAIIEAFPKGKKTETLYLSLEEAKKQPHRIAKREEINGTLMAMIRVSTPCTTKDKVKGLYLTRELAEASIKANDPKEIYVLTDSGPVSLATLRTSDDEGLPSSNLSLNKRLGIINTVLKRVGYPEIQCPLKRISG